MCSNSRHLRRLLSTTTQSLKDSHLRSLQTISKTISSGLVQQAQIVELSISILEHQEQKLEGLLGERKKQEEDENQDLILGNNT